jgi:hypothetical protein
VHLVHLVQQDSSVQLVLSAYQEQQDRPAHKVRQEQA